MNYGVNSFGLIGRGIMSPVITAAGFVGGGRGNPAGIGGAKVLLSTA